MSIRKEIFVLIAAGELFRSSASEAGYYLDAIHKKSVSDLFVHACESHKPLHLNMKDLTLTFYVKILSRLVWQKPVITTLPPIE